MPCDYVNQAELNRRERERLEAEREAGMVEVEQALGAGTAAIVQDALGNWSIEGVPLPKGMHDSCVLASLQNRCSMEFMNACAMNGAENMDFIGAHDDSHK